MSFVGFSISQAQQISAVESGKLDQSVFDAKVALQDAKEVEQDGRLVTAESGLAAQGVRLGVAEATLAPLPALVSANESALTAQGLRLDGAESRLDAVEPRVSAIEGDISTRIQTEINAKVAQATFDALASELRDADSALTTALATKVSAVTQSAVDQAQNTLIQQKASLNDLFFTAQQGQVQIDRNKASLNALEEFVRVFLTGYTIVKADGSNYAYSGAVQGLLIPENPSNILYDPATGALSFDLPNTASVVDFIDIGFNGAFYQFRSNFGAFTVSGSRLSIADVAVAGKLPTRPASGELFDIFVRYDATTGTTVSGYARVNVA